MISYLKGTYRESSGQGFVIVNGIGYKVKTTGNFTPNEEVELLIQSVTMSNGEVVLYGFISEEEQLLFINLVKIPGIGGVMALNILNTLTINELVSGVTSKDKTVFKKVKGLGTKIVDRIISSLEVPEQLTAHGSDVENQAIKALISLGFQAREASNLIKSLSDSSLTTVEEYVAKALQLKGREYNVR